MDADERRSKTGKTGSWRGDIFSAAPMGATFSYKKICVYLRLKSGSDYA
jgi:hypothetical protein